MSSNRERWNELIYPETGTLRNLSGVTDYYVWQDQEAELTSYRAIEIPPEGLGGDTVAEYLKRVHGHLFQDCYSWAGQFRNVPMAKANEIFDDDEVQEFIDPEHIEAFLATIDGDIESLSGLDSDALIETLGTIHAKLNAVHPFRDGNGRTTRFVMTTLAYKHGIDLDWRDAKPGVHFASIASMRDETIRAAPFHALYGEIATPLDDIDDGQRPFYPDTSLLDMLEIDAS
ncbi:Fic/DOC family protein [Corynebacterium renale]|uniref:protein adenylyltransferase n=1 Tax=Corynebacterium renale TaxID=1724 RepID=A0A2A9DLZ8_9CORY|nr:Fic family protein [Corynebacterium renale]PFG27623.1 cell filamentation protein [Corynebacterium renale]SQI22787.1 filamentation induced by cAMP protein fic [Corynebacterium renale]